MANNCGKRSEDTSHAHVACLMYNILSSIRGSDDLSIDFDRDSVRRWNEITNNKTVKVRSYVEVLLRDVFGFAEWHEKVTYGFEYSLTLTTNQHKVVVNRAAATTTVKIVNNKISWYVPHYTLNDLPQASTAKHNMIGAPSELNYVERSRDLFLWDK